MRQKPGVKDVEYIPYVGEVFAVVVGQKIHIVASLDNYGPATHAFYRYGKCWYVRVIESMTDEELYFALEFTLAHDLPTIHISEMR